MVPNLPGNEVATEFPVTSSGNLLDIAVGPDGNLWFTDAGSNEIGRITTDRRDHEVRGPDGGQRRARHHRRPRRQPLVHREPRQQVRARSPPPASVTELACIPTASSGPTNITVGADGRLWLTETGAGKIARVQLP